MDDLNNVIATIKEYLNEDKLNEAEALIHNLDSRNIKDSSFHLQLTDLSEEIGPLTQGVFEAFLLLLIY